MGKVAVQVTVVMPVFNALPYLDAAIESMLAQTFANFHFTIYDDCSTDGSYTQLLAWADRDDRITVVRGTKRLGPCGSSNAAAALARTELVARMDADDVAAPDRLARQIKVLADNPDAVLVGSTFTMIDSAGALLRRAAPGRILGRAPPFAHPSILYRRRDFEAIGGYDPDTDYFEDLGLYKRMARRGRLLVVVDPLLSIRFAGQHPRLSDNRLEVLRKIDRQYGHVSVSDQDNKVSVLAYYSVAVLSILALRRPQMLGEIVRNAYFTKPGRETIVLAMIAVAEVSPRLARALGNLASGLREWVNMRGLPPGTVHEWLPPGDLSPVRPEVDAAILGHKF